MSIWASIQGDDPVVYDSELGGFVVEGGWFDLAVSAANDRVRLLVRGDSGCGVVSLDADGLRELHRRVVVARAWVKTQTDF